MAFVPRLRKRTLSFSQEEQASVLEGSLQGLKGKEEVVLKEINKYNDNNNKEQEQEEKKKKKKKKVQLERRSERLHCGKCNKETTLAELGLSKKPTQWAFYCNDCEVKYFQVFEAPVYSLSVNDPEE